MPGGTIRWPGSALFRGLGKTVFAAYGKQADAARQAQIVATVDHAYEAPTKGFEALLLTETAESAPALCRPIGRRR
jgi:hypothetical protein